MATTENSTRPPDSSSQHDQSEEPEPNPQFCCNICLDTAKDPVVSQCGHLFCWPCLHRWLQTRPDRQECPVCKSRVTKEKCTPIYGHGDDNTKDPREKVPPRPAGRQEQSRTNESPFGGIFGNWGSGGATNTNSNFHVNVSLFPFGLFGGGMTFGTGGGGGTNFASNFGNGRSSFGPTSNTGSRNGQSAEEMLIQYFFLWLALMFFIWFCLSG